MQKVLVLAGGDSDEREVSLRSGTAVTAALVAYGYSAELLDYHASSVSDAQLTDADVVFPALHGKGGEDGQVQQRLERLGCRFVGSDSASSALCMDKQRYKQHLAGKVPMPQGAIVSGSTIWQSPLVQSPFILKPADGGSSVDNIIVRTPQASDKQAISAVFHRHKTMLLEQLVEGVEITVAIVGTSALPVIEIIPPNGEEFDYTNKYNGATLELCPPQHVAAEAQSAAQRLALLAHDLCGCRDMSRTDMFVMPSGQLIVLETNTIPGMTNQSLLPKAAQTAGITMPELTHRLVTMALNRPVESAKA